MKIDFIEFLDSLSIALDYVEKELIGSATHHVQRVALMVNRTGEYMGMDKDKLFALMHVGILHDAALLEYILDEKPDSDEVMNEEHMVAHCIAGENIAKRLPFYELVENAILYHHERADGSGAFGMTAEDTQVEAQLIHMADIIDVTFGLQEIDEDKFEKVNKWVAENRGIAISDECADAFLASMDYEFLKSMEGEKSVALLKKYLPDVEEEIDILTLKEMAGIFAEITDYKSHFTWRHSLGIADKAYKIGKMYGYDDEMCDKLFIAGALHDVGKMLISNDILEKPGKLTSDEYREIQNHAMGTWNLLHKIKGIEDITRWAALHHEKLDGTGYPFGIEASDLDNNERLLACLDIYQALIEKRPYKDGLSHGEAMSILRNMGQAGQLDQSIIEDIDRCFIFENTVHHDSAFEELTFTGETWRCQVCGYIYEGALPADFICPNCEQPSSVFEKVK